ncbi:TonB-dependent receptor [Phaeocystidibacter marisrubri]|uniref:TonB-dependent receptor n=1 Tax=Phaeocystidibacter marisrubri TaxID=1577780 RepID=A0A6L3ZJJ1_9FLAO|nr:TonB-dependent receptor [Phaeocystidibacter marisrubri]KAB2817799.1 TonB-dependent receptor [Phaeocystidibacter marisrubri]GGH73479.1 TonB-dependent receptor [Phaeocystidibacter marisrubri]
MKYIQFLALAVALAAASVSHAQITGQVLDAQDGAPIPGAVLHWQGTEIKVTTDLDGKFETSRPNGSTQLMAHAFGYDMQMQSVIFRTGEINFKLKPESSELNDVVVTGQAKETAINLSAASHQLNINQSELRKAACCNLSESFETNASVDVSFTDAVTGTRQIEMLGLSGKYVLIQRENIPFARGINSSSGLTFIPGPFVESIQLTKGLSSVVNGYESISGQINVEYMKANSEEFDLHVNGFVNQGARLESNVWVTTPVSEKVETGILAHYSNVPFAQDKNGDSFADMPTGEQFNLHNRWKYLLNNGWGGQAGFSITSDTRRSGQVESVFTPEPTEQPWIYNQQNDRYEFFGKNGWVDPNSSTRSLGIVYNASYQDRLAVMGLNQVHSQQQSAYLNVIYQDALGNDLNTFKTGLSFQYDRVGEDLLLYGTTSLDYQRTETIPGAFFEYTYADEGPWTIVLGTRVDYSSMFNWIVTPRANVKYVPRKSTTLRLGGGRGQRTANLITESMNALASGRQFRIHVNPYEAEIAWNMGVSWTEQFLLFERGATFSVDGFYTWFNNKLITDYDLSPYLTGFYYSSGSNSTSVLAQLDFSPIERFDVRLAYKYLKSVDAFADGKHYAYGIPESRAFVNTAYGITETWKVDVTFNWYGSRRLLSTSYYPAEMRDADKSPDYITINMQVNKSFGKQWEAYVGVDNILNYKQENPILNAENPYDTSFETNRVYAPIFGRMIYAGFYYKLKTI